MLTLIFSFTVCNFGQEWEVAEIHTKTQYRAGIKKEIEANIGVKIGLRGINITLKGMYITAIFYYSSGGHHGKTNPIIII